MDRKPIRPDPVVVLAHPAVVASLLGWLVNDWVLKAQFGNEITGKLSDVFAMVVFPLLIAVVAGRVSKYPLQWGLTINTVFFAAINLAAPADRLVERALSVIVPSTLTMDPTDLAVLPVMAVTPLVWRHAHAPSSNARRIARRRLGRIVFVAGTLTCVATSAPEETMSAPHSGAILLTAEQPVLTMPLEYDLNGESNPHLDVRMTITAYGNGADGDVPYGTVEWRATAEELAFELTDAAWAPVHVEWNAEALGDTPDCFGIFWCSDADEATMSIEVPPPVSKPTPDHVLDLPRPADGEWSLAMVTFVIDRAAPPALELPDRSGFVATVDGRQLGRTDRTRTWPIPVPDSCTDPCRVTVPVVYYDADHDSDPVSLGLYGAASAIEVETPRLVETRIELAIEIEDVSVADHNHVVFCLRADWPDTAGEVSVPFAGVAIDFDAPKEPHLASSETDDRGCVAVGGTWIGPEEVADYDQIVVTGVIKTTEDAVPENLEIVLVE